MHHHTAQPMKQALIGIDIGTTSIKAVAFGVNGDELSKATTPTRTHSPKAGWSYFDPAEIWADICAVLRKVLANLPAEIEPAGVAFTSFGETAAPLSREGQPVYDMISWFDARTQVQADWWAETVGEERTSRITGLPVKPVFGILKLLWLRENEPQKFAQIDCWLNTADYGAYRLCGARATDYSLASRMMVLDLQKRAWSQPLLDAIDLPQSILAELLPSGTLLGYVHAEAARETGLPQGLPVSCGGHDHICAALALGITNAGDIFHSMGTAEAVMVLTKEPVPDPAITKQGVGQGIHVYPNRSYAMCGLQFAGGSMDWVRRLLFAEKRGDNLGSDEGSYPQMVDAARAVPPGAEGVFFLPHLLRANPPAVDLKSRGAFIGMSREMSKGHLARAVFEGLAYEAQQSQDVMKDVLLVAMTQMIATGGGTRNDLLMQIKSDLVGRPITMPNVDEATCLGAAILAGVGAGVYRNFEDASEQIRYTSRSVEPNMERHAFYQERYVQVYQKLYETLKEINHTISDWEA